MLDNPIFWKGAAAIVISDGKLLMIKTKESLPIKKALIKNYDVTTHYFLCEKAGGDISFHDPDDAIEEISWKSAEEILELQHDYPEDLNMLVSFIKSTAMEEV